MSPPQNLGQNHYMMTANLSFQNVAKLKYLGNDSIKSKFDYEEIKS
jgi:hypothetical protein